ncbi:uncharacterized protein (DUF427 family) [Microcella putealis]|uniref:Uncharacterized protein (DUF427 family) n=1 Tax=Microcella putealis TaxID=337005 RepID=A0A4Q7LXR7_9MICO|nr:DUF427 domain-containing protein [Microcella putealis]RZS59267.1 uncharacterized protein (DUF427 family) [Microcella putealis]TQM19892.1 uncharacterized protein (DUF427 family) [Microcella putealis]
MRIRPDKPGPGQESVWDYPRPPRVEPVSGRVTIELNGQRIVDTTRALRVLETSHPPTVYVPRADIVDGALRDADGTSFCEFKGRAGYLDVVAGDRVAAKAAWYYPNPSRGYEQLVDHVAIYPGRMDECTLDGELVTAQEGDFYGGWITSRVVGPFKGAPGTWGW